MSGKPLTFLMFAVAVDMLRNNTFVRWHTNVVLSMEKRSITSSILANVRSQAFIQATQEIPQPEGTEEKATFDMFHAVITSISDLGKMTIKEFNDDNQFTAQNAGSVAQVRPDPFMN